MIKKYVKKINGFIDEHQKNTITFIIILLIAIMSIYGVRYYSTININDKVNNYKVIIDMLNRYVFFIIADILFLLSVWVNKKILFIDDFVSYGIMFIWFASLGWNLDRTWLQYILAFAIQMCLGCIVACYRYEEVKNCIFFMAIVLLWILPIFLRFTLSAEQINDWRKIYFHIIIMDCVVLNGSERYM